MSNHTDTKTVTVTVTGVSRLKHNVVRLFWQSSGYTCTSLTNWGGLDNTPETGDTVTLGLCAGRIVSID